jgi:methyl-accepting chemotaxis protein
VVWKQFGPKLERWQEADAKLTAVLEKLAAADTKEEYAKLWPAYIDLYTSQGATSLDARNDLQKIVDLNTKFAADDAASAEHAAASSRSVMFTAAGLAFAALILAAIFIGRAVSVPVGRLRDGMGKVAGSLNFTHSVDLKGRDELSEVAGAFNALVAKVRQSIASVQGLSAKMRSSTEEVSTASQQVEASSQHQSQSTTSMAAAVEEMTVSIGQVSDSASEAMNLSRESEQMSKEGARIISGTMADMNEIACAIEAAAHVIEHLGKQSESILGIVGSIREIAGQTNLLALNAAIEAARAGDDGRGFAVVADEVRKLAEQSADSSSRISQTVNDIVGQTQKAVTQMQEVVQRTHAGREGANRASEFMGRIEKASVNVSAMVGNISDALKEQTSASQEIARHVESIAQMTEESHAASKSTADNARNLLDAVQGVDNTLKVFQVVA